MPIVVTGGAGFIGSNMVRELNRRGREDIWVVDDLENEFRPMTIADCKVDKMIHWTEFRRQLRYCGQMPKDLAILHQGACSNTLETDAERMIDSNFAFTAELLTAADMRLWPIVYASSAAVYGTHDKPVTEEEDNEPLNLYGRSKLMADRFARILMDSLRSSVMVGLRYFNVYGIGEGLKGPMASMPYKMYHQFLRSGRAKLFTGSSMIQRDFVHVDDVVDVALNFLFGGVVRGIFNCGTGIPSAMTDIALLIRDSLPEGCEIDYIPFPKEIEAAYQSYTCADLTELRRAGYEKEFTPPKEGVERMIKQLEENSNES